MPSLAQTGNTNAAAYTWTTLAGQATGGRADGVGSYAQFLNPQGVAVDTNGNTYVADSANFTIRKITPAGVVSTIAGFPGIQGAADGTNSAARFGFAMGVAADLAGNIYVADTGNNTIRRITPVGTNWVVSTIAHLVGSSGPDFPAGLVVDGAGNVFVTDLGNSTIRKITPMGSNWVVSTIAGSPGSCCIDADGTNGTALFDIPNGIAMDGAGNLYVTDDEAIRQITPMGPDWVVTTIANIRAAGIGVDAARSLYVSLPQAEVIQKITPIGTNWVVSTLAGQLGNQGSADGTGTNALFQAPKGVTVGNAGDIFVVDNATIRSITSAGVVRTLAGSSQSSGSTDGVGSNARFHGPQGLAVDRAGNVYVADTHNSTIRQVTSAGEVSTLAGSVTNTGSADGIGSYARFNEPSGLAVDKTGNLYVTDTQNSTIRKITLAGVVSTIAGLAGAPGTNDGVGSTARFAYPFGIAMDTNDNLYVADSSNFTVRKIMPVGTNWVVSTITGQAGSGGVQADGTNSEARFSFPSGVAVDTDCRLYVTDTPSSNSGSTTIRKVACIGSNWVVSTIANLGSSPNSVAAPQGIAVAGAGDIFVPNNNAAILKVVVSGTNYVVSAIGGSILAGQLAGTDGPGSAAQFNEPQGVSVDAQGNVYVADTGNNTIRKGIFTAYTATNAVPFSRPPMDASLVVTLSPIEANGQWRFPWELGWRTNGQAATNLVRGNYDVEFRHLPGWLAFPSSLVGIAVTNSGTTYITNQYYPTIVPDSSNFAAGSLTVDLGPNPPSGAGWRFLGDSTPWPAYVSGFTTNLLPGTYLIEFAGPFNGRATPPNLSVPVVAGKPTVVSVNYLLAQSPPFGVELPVAVPPPFISDLTDYPFGFNGQLQTDVGYGSGVAVQDKVVLTAAHLVFNDQTLSYVSRAYWSFQKEAGVFQPEPLLALGWYMLSGYASQRTNDLQIYAPDVSTPQSRNLDVAALYFQDHVAGGGYGGYLPSDSVPNSWLTSTAQKMLVGYPVDGSLFGDASIVSGRMYEIQPQPYPLSQATDPVANQQVYTANWFLSYPGNSGGPLYVQFNGYYYPAGVYLGTLYNGTAPYASAVRAIDSDVVNLITLAETLGETGTNNTGGGVINFIPTSAITTDHPAYVQVLLGPSAAVQGGAGWRLQGDQTYGYASNAPNYLRFITTNGASLEFAPVPGWDPPTNQIAQITPGALTVISNAFYSRSVIRLNNAHLISNGALVMTLQGTTGRTYSIVGSTNLLSSLSNWLNLITFTNTAGQTTFTNPRPSSTPFFYRAREL